MSFILDKHHIALNSCEDIAEIMLSQLNKHGINVFNYYKYYTDGTVIRLSTHRLWTEHYFRKNYLNSSTVPPSYLAKSLNYFIWLTEDCPEMLLDAALNFDIDNGISIAEKHENYIEYFCFATTRNNRALINFYLNNLELLQQYCRYFKIQAAFLLNLSEKNKIITTSNNQFIKSTETLLQSSINSFLSPRQLDCATLMLKGMTAKEIAATLNLSSRTIETHLNQIKAKLQCGNKTELIIKLSDLLK